MSGSAALQRHVPERTCIGCRQRRPREALLRLVVAGGHLRVDPARCLPGRGAWLCPSERCFRNADRRGVVERAFRGAVVPGDASVAALWQEGFASAGEGGTTTGTRKGVRPR
ncbi:MAG: YlxR family protein [Deltaproteobacteria bacterium]|nr:YlxR family protein [Deltaproteobacteria bacterium]